MSGVTDNYGLILVDEGESYDEEIFNTNNKAIDTQMKAEANARAKIRYAEFTTPSATFPNSLAQWGIGTPVVDAGNTYNNSFVQSNGVDSIKALEVGLYEIVMTFTGAGGPPEGEMGMKKNAGVQFANDDLKRFTTNNPTLTGTIYLAPNDIVVFYTFNRKGAFTASTRIKVTKLQG